MKLLPGLIGWVPRWSCPCRWRRCSPGCSSCWGPPERGGCRRTPAWTASNLLHWGQSHHIQGCRAYLRIPGGPWRPLGAGNPTCSGCSPGGGGRGGGGGGGRNGGGGTEDKNHRCCRKSGDGGGEETNKEKRRFEEKVWNADLIFRVGQKECSWVKEKHNKQDRGETQNERRGFKSRFREVRLWLGVARDGCRRSKILKREQLESRRKSSGARRSQVV